jgi:Uma2 family endonuclease
MPIWSECRKAVVGYELYDGEVFVVPAPLPRHHVVQFLLLDMLRGYAKAQGPDVVPFTPARAHLVDPDRVIRAAPDLCVDVLSPSSAAPDRGRKMQTFARTASVNTGLSIRNLNGLRYTR